MHPHERVQFILDVRLTAVSNALRRNAHKEALHQLKKLNEFIRNGALQFVVNGDRERYVRDRTKPKRDQTNAPRQP